MAAFQTALDNCATAIAAGNFSSATSYYAQAEAINAGLAVESAHGSTRTRRRESLAGLRAAIEAARLAVQSESDPRRTIKLDTGYAS